ncbi:MAG: sulfurtransferase [Solirubrobacteraceae bacterium]
MGGLLINADELRESLASVLAPNLLDVRWTLQAGPQLDEYARGHIPGAAFVDLERDLSAPAGLRGRHPLPDAAEFEDAMRRAGVRADRAVVVYDDAGGLPAARAWWLLRYFGHWDVSLLDGGLRAWKQSGGELETGALAGAAAGDFTAVPGGMPVLDADSAGALARVGVLLDARAPERFAGDVEPLDPVAGHIPGARNWPMARSLGSDGRLLDPAALRASLPDLGGLEVGAYCGSGVTAAHTVLALELAGISAALYPGSWSEWVADPRRPVATGSE